MRQDRWFGKVLGGCMTAGLVAAAVAGCTPDGTTEGTDAYVESEFPVPACVGRVVMGRVTLHALEPGRDALITVGLPAGMHFVGDSSSTMKLAGTGSVPVVCDEPGDKPVDISFSVDGGEASYQTVTVSCMVCDDGGLPDGDLPDGGLPDGGGMDGGEPTLEGPACDGPLDVPGEPHAVKDSEGTEPFLLASGFAESIVDHIVLTIIDSCSAAGGCTTHERVVESPDPDNTDYVESRPGTGAVTPCGDLVRAEFALSDGSFVPGVWAFVGGGPAHMSSVDAATFSDDARFAAENADAGLQLHVLEPSASEGVVATETLDLGISSAEFGFSPFVCNAAAGTPSRPACFVVGTGAALSADDTDTDVDVYSVDVAGGPPYTPTRILQGADVVDVTPETGRFVVVRSSNDLDGESPGLLNRHVFVLDRDVSGDGTLDEAGDTSVERVSNRDDGGPVGYVASWGTISDDGRFVTYVAKPSGTTAGLSPLTYTADNLFVHDRETGDIALVSASASGEPADGDVTGAQITPDGTAVLFATTATNLDPDDTDPGSTFYIAANPLAE